MEIFIHMLITEQKDIIFKQIGDGSKQIAGDITKTNGDGSKKMLGDRSFVPGDISKRLSALGDGSTSPERH